MVKCGGTTVNSFIATKFYANRALDASSINKLGLASKSLIDKPSRSDIKAINKRLVSYRFNNYDFVHGHSPLAWFAPNDYFKLIILRDPVERVISQIMDWKRLTPEDLKYVPKENGEFKSFVRSHSIKAIIKKWNEAEVGRVNLNNMQTRLVFMSKLGIDYEFDDFTPSQQIAIAKEALEDYNLVGLTQNLNETLVQLCYLNEWCPPAQVHSLNTNAYNSESDFETLNDIKELNLLDQELYDSANQIYNKQSQNLNYSIAYFESHFAETRTRAIAPVYFNNTYLFDFNMPIIGNGFHMRDASNTPECAIWTGPETNCSLFFPVIAKCDIKVLLYIKGYADASIKKTIKVYIDGKLTPHDFKNEEGFESILTANCVSQRAFIHLKIEMDETFKSDLDIRPRGVSIIKYGYSCNV